MKRNLTPHRPAWAALFAVMTLPATALSAQDVSAPPIVNVTPPPIVVTTPPPPPVAAPPPVSVAPQPRIVAPAPPPVEAEAAPAPRTARAAPPRTRAAVPVRRAVSAPAPAASPAPVAAPEALAPAAPVAAAPAPVAPLPADVGAASVSEPVRSGSTLWLLLIAGVGVLVAAIALLARRRRRAAEEVYEDNYYEPAHVEPAPVLAEPVPYVAAAALTERDAEPAEQVESVAIVEPDAADVAAMAAESEPVADRPWLELLLRPIRAGTTDEDAIVEFELTVGNTGSVAARDVRISSWMFAAGSAQESDMERMLIDPPAESRLSEGDIAPGDGTKVEASMALSCSGLRDAVTPIVVADARYTLPDGSEGRTSASFAIGTGRGEELEPLALHNAGGMRDDVGARLHGTPTRD